MVLYNWHILAVFLFIWESFMMVALPTDKTFDFGPTSSGGMSETLAVLALLYQN